MFRDSVSKTVHSVYANFISPRKSALAGRRILACLACSETDPRKPAGNACGGSLTYYCNQLIISPQCILQTLILGHPPPTGSAKGVGELYALPRKCLIQEKN